MPTARESPVETPDLSTEARQAEALLKTGALQRAIFNSANFSSIATDGPGRNHRRRMRVGRTGSGRHPQSGNGDQRAPHRVVKSYALGVNAYVVKPLKFQDFVETVKQVGMFWAVINEVPGSVCAGERMNP